MLARAESPFAGVPIDARVEGLRLEVLTATGDGDTVSLYVPPLLREHALSAHVDLEQVFSRWPSASRWRVEFLGEAAMPASLDIGVLDYLRDIVCGGVQVLMLGVPTHDVATLRGRYTGLEPGDAEIVVDEDDADSCTVRWSAA